MTPKESLRYLERVADSLCVGGIASHVLHDDRFYLWSGSSRIDQHHYGKHGLVVHTAEVALLCISNNEYLGNKLDHTELFLSALFHDCGKMWDYEPVGSDYEVWGSTPHKRTIHHISRSAIEWNLASYCKETCERYAYISEDLLNTVTHNILAHHGQRAWGSPVAPKTGAAWMLHLCDGMSARMNDCDSLDLYGSSK
jgi:3'-5' exoribonuclease